MPTVKETILTLFDEVMETMSRTPQCRLTDDAVLLQTGMDSLGFAILVARLEQDLGYDPFVLMDTPFYPETFGEFVEIYARFESHRTR